MWRYVLHRLVAVIPVMLLVSLISFSLILLIPGDPAVAIAGESATHAQISAIRAELGLNRPVLVQYVLWVGHALTGDLGNSIYTSQPVAPVILERLPVMLSLSVGALVVALILGLPAGVASAVKKDRFTDRSLSVGVAGGLAFPNYFVGMLLIILVSLKLGWLPATGYTSFSTDPIGWLQHLILPSIALGLVPAAVLARQLRGSLIGVLEQDYVRTATAKGMLGRTVLLKHALKNAAISPITALSTQFAAIVGGSVVVEQVFGISGLGALAINAVQTRDIPVIQGIVIVSAVLVQVINILVDISYGWLNPKIRVSS